MPRITELQMLLRRRVEALAGARIGYEPHRDTVAIWMGRPVSKLRLDREYIDTLAWRYRRQIAPALVPQGRPA